MKTLVTGGTGFTGSHLARRLMDRGYEVRVLDTEKGLFYDELRDRGAAISLGTVNDRPLVENLVRGCEVVFHTAAAFRQLGASRKHYWNVNVEGTRTVAEASHYYGVRRLVYCSTCGVHGNVKSPPCDEEAPIVPEDYYQYTKNEGERILQRWVDKGLDAVILRPAAIYGPGDPGRFLMLFRLVHRGYFPMFGPGRTLYHPLYIDNLIDAFEHAAQADRIKGKAFLVADDRYWTLNELVEQVAEAIGVTVRIYHYPYLPLLWAAWVCEVVCRPLRISPPIFRRRVAWYKHDRAFSIAKAKELLGYQPRVDLSTGLRKAVKWYRDNGYL